MPLPKLLNVDNKEHLARLQLSDGEIVLCKGAPIATHVYTAAVLAKNLFGLPTKRIWHFGMTDVLHTPEYAADFAGMIGIYSTEQNVVYIDLSRYSALPTLVGYAALFPSVQQMSEAQGRHRDTFNAEKAAEMLKQMGCKLKL